VPAVMGVSADAGAAGQPQQPRDPFAANPDAYPEAQFAVDARPAIRAARGGVDVDDRVGQVGVGEITHRRVRLRSFYCLAMAMRRRSSGAMKWSWSSSPKSIWTHLIVPVNRLVRGV